MASILRNFSKLCKYPKTVPYIKSSQENYTLNKKYIHISKHLLKKSIYKDEVKKIQSFFLLQYMEYVKKLMTKQFPAAIHVYRIFTIGIKDFFVDLKKFMKIIRLMATNTKGQRFEILTRQEIELYHQMPKDMIKITPVLILSAIPFSNYIVLPLIYYFPRQLLSTHFWSIQQRSEFKLVYLAKKLRYNRGLFRCMQERLPDLIDDPLYDKWSEILATIGSGSQPSTKQIIECSSLFSKEPYSLQHIYGNHAKALARIHNVKGLFLRYRLLEHGSIIYEIDRAITREGGVHNTPSEALREACFMRGLNPMNMSSDEIILWLNQWIAISKTVTPQNMSLLLHCPILLGYNQPSNWLLIY